MTTIAGYLFLSDGGNGHARYAREGDLDGLRILARRQPGRLFKRNERGEMSEVENLGSRRGASELVSAYQRATTERLQGEAHARRRAASNPISRQISGQFDVGPGAS